jgi:AcrR family transcriptional regulator
MTPAHRLAREDDSGTEDRILDAARRVFTRSGTAGARMQEIAAEAGVNSALLYYYFRSKDELADRIFVEAAGRMVAALAPLGNPRAELDELIRHFVHGYIDTVRQFPFVPGYVVAEMHQHPGRMQARMARVLGTLPSALNQTVLARIGELIDAGVRAGTVRPLTPRQVMLNILALTVMPFVMRPLLKPVFAMNESEFEDFLDERKRELPEFILRGLRT